MKKKKLLIIIILIILCYGIFVTVDCVRLRYSESGTEPLITIGKEENGSSRIYKGLGYTVEYYTNIICRENEKMHAYVMYVETGAEFRIFDIISIWSWEE